MAKKQKAVFQVENTEEMKYINNKLHLSYIIDLKKPNVNKIERAKVIQHYMKENLISFGELSKQLQIGKSTLSGWLKWANLTPNELAKLKEDGYTETQITTLLKGDAPRDKESMLLINLKSTREWVQKVNGKRLSKKTLEAVKQLRNDLNAILYRAEQ